MNNCATEDMDAAPYLQIHILQDKFQMFVVPVNMYAQI